MNVPVCSQCWCPHTMATPCVASAVGNAPMKKRRPSRCTSYAGGKSESIMGEAIVTNWAIAAMGIGILFVVNLVSPGVLRTMSEHLPGQIILAASSIVFVISLIIIRRITRIDV